MTCHCRSGECDPECDGPALRAEIEQLRALKDALLEVRDRIVTENAQLRAALEEITEGKGAYSPDRLEHASNCIDDMKAIARRVLERRKE